MELGKLTKIYRIQHGKHFRLKDTVTRSCCEPNG